MMGLKCYLKGLKLICHTGRYVTIFMSKTLDNIFIEYKLTTVLFSLKVYKLSTKYLTGNYCLKNIKGFYMKDVDQLFSMDTESKQAEVV